MKPGMSRYTFASSGGVATLSTSTRPIRIWSISATASGGDTVVLVLTPDDNGTEIDRVNISDGTCGIRGYRDGLFVPSGCVLELDVSLGYVTVSYSFE